jgi:hypothetical protein
VSGGGSHLCVGGETAIRKEALVSFFLLIGGGEREREWSQSHTSATVGWWLAGLAGTRRSADPLSRVELTRGRFEADLSHAKILNFGM